MADSTDPGKWESDKAVADKRHARLAASLRENLRKRKRQAAERKVSGGRDRAAAAIESDENG